MAQLAGPGEVGAERVGLQGPRGGVRPVGEQDAALSRETNALPGWLIDVTYLVGVVELVSFTVAEPTGYVFPAWIGLVSIVPLIRDRPAHLQPPASS